MAEPLALPREMRVDLGGVKIEWKTDGTVLVFVPPGAFSVMFVAGEAGISGQSASLYHKLVIAPRFSAEAAARPTQQVG